MAQTIEELLSLDDDAFRKAVQGPGAEAEQPSTPAMGTDALGSMTGFEAPDATPATSPVEAPAAEGPGLVSRVLSDIGTGLKEAPGAVLRGAASAGNEILQSIDEAGDWLNQNVVDLGTPQWPVGPDGGLRSPIRSSRPEDGIAANPIPMPEAPQSTTGGFVEKAAQFAAGFIGAGRIIKMGGVAGGLVKGAAADAFAFDPREERVSNFLQQVPALQNPVVNYLAASPEDSSAEGRLKNALEGAGIGAAVESVFLAFKAFKASKAGKAAEADTLTEAAADALPGDVVAKEEMAGTTPAPKPEATVEAPEGLPAAAEVAPPVDTRGSGRIFHGTNTDLGREVLSAGASGDGVIYGKGFYTSDATDIVEGYARNRTKSTRQGEEMVWEFDEREGVRLFDLEQPIRNSEDKMHLWDEVSSDPQIMAAAYKWAVDNVPDFPKIFDKEYGEYISGDAMMEMAKSRSLDELARELPDGAVDAMFGALRQSDVSMRGIMDTGRQMYGQDFLDWTVDRLTGTLEELGFNGLKHTGGKLTNSPEHTVKIYWNPERDLINRRRVNKPEPTKAEDGPAPSQTEPEVTFRAADDAAERKLRGLKSFVDISPERRKEIVAAALEAVEGIDPKGVLKREAMGDVPKNDPRRFDWTAISDAEELVAVSRAIGKETLKSFKELKVSHQATAERAKEIAVNFGHADADEWLTRLHGRSADSDVLAAETYAYTAMVKNLQKNLVEMARDISQGTVPKGYQTMDEATEAFEKAGALYVDVSASVQNIASNIGRALNIRKASDVVDPALFELRKGRAEEAARLLVEFADNPQGMVKALQKTYEPGWLDKTASYFKANLLWSPPTHIINIGTAFGQTAMRPLTRIVGGAMTGNTEVMATGVKQGLQMMYLLGDSLKAARQAIALGRSTLDPSAGTKFIDGEAATERLIKGGGDGWTDAKSIGINVANALWSVQQMPFRLLDAQDDFFANLAAKSLIVAETQVKGQRAGKSAVDIKADIVKALKESFDENTGQIINPKALEEARNVTFKQNLEPGILREFQVTLAKHPVLQIAALPFFKTPVNLFKQSMRYTPGINALVSDVRTRFKSGPEGQAAVLGEMGVGVMLWTAAITAAQNGLITDGGPTEQAARSAKQQTGWRSYSIKKEREDGSVVYIPLSNTDPFGMILSMAADLSSVWDKAEIEGGYPELEDAAMAAFWAVMRNAQERNFFDGLSNLLSLAERSGDEYGLKKWLASTASGFVPMSAGVAWVNSFNDPTLKDARGLVDRFLARLPGGSGAAPAKRNWLGEPVEKEGRLVSVQENDVLAREYNTYADVNELAPQAPTPRFRVKGVDVDLREIQMEDGRWASDVYADTLTELRFKGRTLRETLEGIVTSERYRNLSDRRTTQGGSKFAELMRVRERYVEAAKATFIRQHPEVREKINQRADKIIKAQDVRSRLYRDQGEEPMVMEED